MRLKAFLRRQFDLTRPGVTMFGVSVSIGILFACAAAGQMWPGFQ